MKGFQVEPQNSPIVKGVHISRLDSALRQVMRELVIKDSAGKYLTPEQVAGLIWEKL